MTRLDKFPRIGGYVKVIGRIAREAISPFIVILILLCGFLEAFKNRSIYKGQQDTSSFDTINNFNQSFEYNGFQIYAMMIGNLPIEKMGVDNLTGPNLVNFVIYFIFMFLISSLAFNIFTGIAINEIQSLIEDSNIQIMKDKIDYIYDGGYSIFIYLDGFERFRRFKKRFFEIVSKVYRIKWLVEKMISCCKMKCLNLREVFKCADKKQPDKKQSDKKPGHEIDLKQMDFVDDKYIENFETLEYRTKHLENKLENRTKKLEDKLNTILFQLEYLTERKMKSDTKRYLNKNHGQKNEQIDDSNITIDLA